MELEELINCICIADNAYVIGKFGRAMKYSMMKTFAFKYKTKVSKIKKKYVKNGDFTVSYETKQGLKTSVFYNQGYGNIVKVKRIHLPFHWALRSILFWLMTVHSSCGVQTWHFIR